MHAFLDPAILFFEIDAIICVFRVPFFVKDLSSEAFKIETFSVAYGVKFIAKVKIRARELILQKNQVTFLQPLLIPVLELD